MTGDQVAPAAPVTALELAQHMQALAREGLAGKALSSAVLDATDAARAQLRDLMVAAGVRNLDVSTDDGSTTLGSVGMQAGVVGAEIHDEAALIGWVAQRYPSEIMQAVRRAFAEKLLAECRDKGRPVDVRTGEEIPGIRVFQGEPFIKTFSNAEAKERARTLVDGGGLAAITTRPDSVTGPTR